MRTVPLIAITGLIALSAFACGKRKNDSPVVTVPMPSLEAAQEAARSSYTLCSPDSPCNESVAFLTSASPDQVGMCSGFLVAPNIIATNSHCIPADLKASGSQCTGRIWAHLPVTSQRTSEHLECDRVLFASETAADNRSPDFAFIRLSSSSERRPYEISREGLADGSRVSVTKINPPDMSVDQPVFVGTQETVQCKVVQNSQLFPEFTHSFDPVGMISDCTIIGGNSGSPVLGSNGKVHGIIYAAYTQAQRDEALRTYQSGNVVVEDSNLAMTASLTNFACASFPLEITAPRTPEVCANHRMTSHQDAIQIQSQQREVLTLRTIETRLNSWAANHPELPVEWSILQLTAPTPLFQALVAHYNPAQGGLNTLYYTIRPRCVKPGAQAREHVFNSAVWHVQGSISRHWTYSMQIQDPADVPRAVLRIHSSNRVQLMMDLREAPGQTWPSKTEMFTNEVLPVCETRSAQ